MGNFVSVSISCDETVYEVHLVYQSLCFHKIEKNLTALETAMDKIKAMRDDLSRWMEREEYRELRMHYETRLWFSIVETTENEVNGLLIDRTRELQRLCLCGFFSMSFKLSYAYAKLVFIMLKRVKSMYPSEVLEVIAKQAQASELVEKPIQSKIIGQELVLETAWNHLTEAGVGLLGLHGIGGVGKTTLLKQINNKFLNIENAFSVVIWVVVSKDLHIQKIQEKVAKKLDLVGEDWNHKDEEQKACDIHHVLKRKKFVLLLDDIWGKVDLTKIGIPFPNRENGSKVIFTTRSQEVCVSMGVNIQMQVQCLEPKDALELFRDNVGEIMLESYSDIPKRVEVVAERCHGLPLALTVIGKSMSYKWTIEYWDQAIYDIDHHAADAMENEILPILKFSYNKLESERVKACLPLCTSFTKYSKISKDKLIEYWMWEGLIDESEGFETAEKQGYEIISTLFRSSLLTIELDEDNGEMVYIHDVIRDMLLWVASSEVPKVKNWKAARELIDVVDLR